MSDPTPLISPPPVTACELFPGIPDSADLCAIPRAQVERLYAHLLALGSSTVVARALLREQCYPMCQRCASPAEPGGNLCADHLVRWQRGDF